MKVVKCEKIKNVTVLFVLLFAVLFVARSACAQADLWSTDDLIYSNMGYGTVGQTNYSVEQLTANDFFKMNPAINNLDDIAWVGYPTGGVDWKGSEIFFRPGGSSVITQLTDNDYRDYTPNLNDLSEIVWYGGLASKYNIFLYSEGIVSKVTTNNRDNRGPQINNASDITWFGMDEIENDWEIFLRSNGSTSQISDNEWKDVNPKINIQGDIVWECLVGNTESDWEIFLNLDGQGNPARITEDDLRDYGPHINDNGDLVWEFDDGQDWEIVLKYKDSAEPLQLTNNETEDWYPQINEWGAIVWQGQTGEGEDWEIFFFTPDTPGTVYQITNNSFDDMFPQINAEGDISWMGFGEEDTGIYLFEADTQQIHKLGDAALAMDRLRSSVPSINDQGKVAWHAPDGSGYEVFLASPPAENVHGDVYLFPQRLNIQSRGQGFTMYVNFKDEGQEIPVDRIDTSTIRLTMVNDTPIDEIAPLPNSDFEIVDFDADGVFDMTVKFDRQEIIAAIKATVEDLSAATLVSLSVEGQFLDGTLGFIGSETIKVTNRKESKVKKAKTEIIKISKAKNNKGKQLGKKKK